MIPTIATHTISIDDARAWLAEHGIDIRTVIDASIRIGYPAKHGHPAWLDVEWYKHDTGGRKFADETGERAATGTASIPLRSWPSLTPAVQP